MTHNTWVGVCPECFAEVTGESVFADGKLAVCRRCDGAFVIDAVPTIPQIAKRPEKRCGVQIERADDRLTVSIPPPRNLFGWIFVGGFVFATFMMLMCILNTDGSFKDVSAQIGMGSFFGLFDLLCLFFVLLFFFYHRTFVFDAEQLHIEKRLFFLRFRQTIPRSSIWGVRSDWTPTQAGNIFSFYLTYGKKAMEITCRSQEETRWVTSEINGFLNSTAVERLCCPVCNRGVIDQSHNKLDLAERKCVWCAAKFNRSEAAQIGADELDNPWRSEYDLLRPLDTSTRVVQDENELTISFGKRGVQGNWEKFGIVCVLLFGVSIIPEIVFLFYPNISVKIVAGYALVLSVMLFGLFGWVAVVTFWVTGQLRITRGEIFAESKWPLCKKREFQVVRSPNVWAEPTPISEQVGFSCTNFGKFQIALFNGDDKGVQIKRRSYEEILWLQGIINRFLARTNDEKPLRRAKCPACRCELSLQNFRPGDVEKLHCPRCERDSLIADCLNVPAETLVSNLLKRPRLARAIVRQNSESELVIDYPSRKGMPNPRSLFWIRLFFYSIFLVLAVVGIYMSVKCAVNVCPFFFQAFAPLRAVLLSILTICSMSGGAFAYFLMFWGVGNAVLSSWTLHIDRNKITLTTRAFFTTKQTEAERTDDIRAESVKENFGFNWQKWLQIRYWLDAEPAWSGNHFQLTTDPAIPFPFHNAEEQEWLLRLINDFLQQSR